MHTGPDHNVPFFHVFPMFPWFGLLMNVQHTFRPSVCFFSCFFRDQMFEVFWTLSHTSNIPNVRPRPPSGNEPVMMVLCTPSTILSKSGQVVHAPWFGVKCAPSPLILLQAPLTTSGRTRPNLPIRRTSSMRARLSGPRFRRGWAKKIERCCR